ncbi:hypothetical protein GCM10009133_10940 [Cocleimonas flava]|jgi:ABC-type enterochelin transport system substrate-binding protein|uniref:Lipoprotein n=1 Tax=Cocleimonas flava TaxID=634765 RepID=A0A4V2P8Y1_9GAMM|nr:MULTISPECIES: hypothetical protein [Cocleimonas]MEB8434421.1 hypothetical protein [Cocleimonas sp. KMM 6892]MEC4717314.1 hypothetical protein [Cocleimonas sp. KMM 6895]MEC4746693.1 hypothetical protein [Cocleimonas sp. KMM 6896]TCJ87455.1 hypothetical protein EV695_1965 [Cocleimonas flava]
MKSKTIASTLFVVMAALSISACSSDNQRGGKRGGSGGKPPAEAFEACASKSEGQSCTVSSSRGEMSGTCKAPPKGEGELACVPAGKRPK